MNTFKFDNPVLSIEILERASTASWGVIPEEGEVEAFAQLKKQGLVSRRELRNKKTDESYLEYGAFLSSGGYLYLITDRGRVVLAGVFLQQDAAEAV